MVDRCTEEKRTRGNCTEDKGGETSEMKITKGVRRNRHKGERGHGRRGRKARKNHEGKKVVKKVPKG